MKAKQTVNHLQYATLLLTPSAMLVGWRLGLWTSLAAAAVSLLKVLQDRHLGNPALGRPLRIALLCPVLYWAAHLVGLALSADTAVAWGIVGLKASVLIFPLCLLLTDTSYLTPRHLRGAGYALVATVCAAFVYWTVRSAVTGEEFSPIHHAYTALYIAVGLAFVYTELSSRWPSLRPWVRALLLAAVPVGIAYLLRDNSRAGLLCVVLLAVGCLAHMVLRKRWLWQGLAVAAALVAIGLVCPMLIPDYEDRLVETIENREEDARTPIYTAAWQLCRKSPLVGHGLGDYRGRLTAQYAAIGYDYGVQERFNAHNQYFEDLLAMGLIGLLPLLAFLLAPAVVVLRDRHPDGVRLPVLLLTGIAMFNLLFESMLQSQKGLLFIACLYSMMVLIISMEKNKFGRIAK